MITCPEPSSDFTKRCIACLASIPRGRVATYGQIAGMCGDPRAARQVVWILRTCSDKESLPWHRVLSSQARISLPGEGGRRQRAMLESEGIEFDADGRLDLDRFRWRPG
ncbi:MGMT family protein [candidate division WOR-3 bacterium]|nr:MGMT family protein [candidate division WOR-3 bacterium]